MENLKLLNLRLTTENHTLKTSLNDLTHSLSQLTEQPQKSNKNSAKRQKPEVHQ